MTFYDELLSLPEFHRDPPVLVDVGAAGFLQPQWRPIARHAVYVGFDPDAREMDYLTRQQSIFKRFHIVRAVVSEVDGETRFHFTRSPQCSSTLQPNTTALKDWSFSRMFDVKITTSAPSIRLDTALTELSLDAVDWFKTDSQGTDLRLLKSLGDNRLKRLIAAELEPGIEDAYDSEDKMHAVMAFMETQPFWLNALTVKGPPRIRKETLHHHFTGFERRFFRHFQAGSAFYGEMEYLNTFTDADLQDRRSLVLGWIVSTIKKQHGFALELALLGHRRHGEIVFIRLRDRSIKLLRRRRILLPAKLLGVAWKTILRKMHQ